MDKDAELLKGQIFEMKEGFGISKEVYKEIQIEKDQAKEQLLIVTKKIEAFEAKNEHGEKKEIQLRDKVQTEKDQLTAYLKHQEEKQDELSESKISTEKSLRFAQRKFDDAENLTNSETKIEDENEVLKQQKVVLNEQKIKLHKELMEKNELTSNSREEAEGKIKRLTEANERFEEESRQLDLKRLKLLESHEKEIQE